MSNLEGSPVGSFPEVREGLQAAVKEINEKLGGIGGRAISLKTCTHGLDPNEATNCANTLLADKPTVHVNGVEFLSPVVYPVMLGSKVPILNAVPIFVADTNTVGVHSANPGCLEFVGDVRDMVQTGHDRIAVVSALPLGPECAKDITSRALDVLTKGTGTTYKVFEQQAGDPSDDPAMIQTISQFLAGSKSPGIFLPESAADCNTDLNDLATAGVKADVYMSNSCADESVLSNPNSVGSTISIVDYTTDLASKDPFLQLQLDTRDAALKALPTTAAAGGFMNSGFRDGILIWTVLNQMVKSGANVDDPVAVGAALTAMKNTFAIGSAPIDCVDAGKEYVSVCLNETTFGKWDGTKFTYPAPNSGEFKSYSDVLTQMAAQEPRAAG